MTDSTATSVSSRRFANFVLVAAMMAAATIGVFVASLAVGPTQLAPADFIDSLVAFDLKSDAHVVARDIRLPRALLALIVGASLAAAGAAMQGVTRNPIAGPSIMGLSGGASLAGLVALIAVPGLSYNGAILASLVGAAGGYGCVGAVACLSPDGFSPTRLTLAGAVTSALFASITQGLVIAFAMSGEMLYWTVGGIANVTWNQVLAVAPCFVVGTIGLVWLSPGITILSLGNEVAVGLGQRAGAVRIGATLFVLILCGGAVAVAGPVAFVGLMAPHVCRMAVGADYRRLIPLSAVFGAALTGLADLFARTALGEGQELPMGIVTGAIGAPFFVWLVRRRARSLDGGVPGASIATERPSLRLVLPALAVVFLVAVVVAAHSGRMPFAPATIVRTLAGFGDAQENLALWSFRFPRIAFAGLVGIGIAISGAAMQGVLRNDLAEPGILGVSAGSSLAIVLALAVAGYAILDSVFLLPAAAVVGAVAATLLVCLLCWDGQFSSTRLLLTGVAISSALSAVALFASMQIGEEAREFTVAFSAGSLAGAGWNYVGALTVWLGVTLPLLWLFAPTLNVVRLGDAVATGLGVRVALASFGLLALAVAIGAACMSLAGGIAFLGLIAPHIARRLVGENQAILMPTAGAIGAMLLLAADVLGTHALPGIELPAGVMVSALGAPYFLFLLTRR